jgi:Arc/MetJ family transcription regulator
VSSGTYGRARLRSCRRIYARGTETYTGGVTKRLVDIDDADLDAAREALSTSTIKETVGRALREAAASAARRREVERLLDGSSTLLAAGTDRDRAWR